jgi:hypothetical protein
VASSLAENNNQTQALKQGNEAELLKRNSAIENIEARLSSGQKPVTSAENTSPQLAIVSRAENVVQAKSPGNSTAPSTNTNTPPSVTDPNHCDVFSCMSVGKS